MPESSKTKTNKKPPSIPKNHSSTQINGGRICIVCNTRPARESRNLCRTCETNKYMIQKYDNFKNSFDHDTTSFGRMMRDFITFLDNSYGDQKREIAYRIQYTIEAFEKGNLTPKAKWTIDDISAIEQYRSTLSVQKRTALFHFVEFLKEKYGLTDATDELKIHDVVLGIPTDYQDISMRYLDFLKIYRKFKHWTRLQLAYSLKYLFTFLHENYQITDTRQVGSLHMRAYISWILSKNSQKNAYTRFNEASNFFKWALRNKLAFSNPCNGIDVNYGHELTQPLSEEEQKKLLKRWMNTETDPREALVGILSLVYACSLEELRYLPLRCIEGDRLIIPGRPATIKLTPIIEGLFERYLTWRDSQCRGSYNDYLIISRISYKRNQPIGLQGLRNLFIEMGVNLRELRSTRFHDIARSGHLKLLEGLGLGFEGTRQYINAATPVLLMDIDNYRA